MNSIATPIANSVWVWRGYQINYQTAGDTGAAVLLIHGFGASVGHWRKNIPVLAENCRCYAIDLILQNGRVGEVYNVGGGEELPNMKVIDTLCAAFDKRFAADPSMAQRFPDSPCAKGLRADSLKTYVKDRPGHDKRYAIDETKIRTELGYKPQHSFETAMVKTIDWYLANESWWRAVLDGSYREWIKKNYG